MTDYETRNVKELFSRLFVLCVNNKMNLSSFTVLLSKSSFIEKIEKGAYDDIVNEPIEDLFESITGFSISVDSSFGVYNDAYWCGRSYWELHQRLNKSFAYIFLKLPFEKMMDLYPVYHEMDLSSLVEYFKDTAEKKTILRLLCNSKRSSLTDVSKATMIKLSSLKKYNSSDDLLLNASFQNVYKIGRFFDVPLSLFEAG